MARHGSLAANDNQDLMRNVICGNGNIDVLSEDAFITERQELKVSHPLRMLAANLRQMQSDAGEHSSVYVISDIFGKSVKIGEAKDVNKRLSQLQPGNPNRLYAHRAFWFRNKQYAQYVENHSHHEAGSRGFRRLQSEWFLCSPSQAHNLILSTIDFLQISRFGVVTPGSDHWVNEEAA